MTTFPPERFKSLSIAVYLFILSFFLRLSLMSAGPYHMDCLSLALNAQKTFETGQFSPALGFGYPVVVGLGALLIGVFRFFDIMDPVIAINFLSVLSGSMAVVMFYLFTKLLLDERTAVFGALLFSTSPIFLATSVYGMNHVPAVCFLLAGLYCLLSYLKQGRMHDFIAVGLWLGLMGGSRLQDMVLIIPAVGVWFFLKNRPLMGGVNSFFNLIIIILIVLGVLHLSYLKDTTRSLYGGQIQDYWHAGLITNFQGPFSPHLKYGLQFLLNNFLGAGILLSVIGFLRIWNGRKTTAVFLAVWFLVPFLFLSNLLTFVPRFLIVLVPPLVICQACALAYYSRWKVSGRFGSMTILVLLLVAQVFPVWKGLFFRHHHAAVIDFSRWVNQVTEEKSKIIVGDEGVFISYYGNRSVFGHLLCMDGCSQESLNDYGRRIDDWMKEGNAVYITEYGLLTDNPKGEFAHFIKSHYEMVLVGEHLMEDWHYDVFQLNIWNSKLYRLQTKTR